MIFVIALLLFLILYALSPDTATGLLRLAGWLLIIGVVLFALVAAGATLMDMM